MRKLYGLILVFAIPTVCIAQSAAIDSLKNLLRKEKQDSNRSNLLSTLGFAFIYSKPDTAFILAQEGLLLAKKNNYVNGELRNMTLSAIAYNQTGNSPKALKLYYEILQKAEEANDLRRTAVTLGNIAIIYHNQKDYRQAISITKKALEIGRKIKDDLSICSYLSNIAAYYGELNMLDSAVFFSNQAYDLSLKTGSGNIIAGSLQHLGDIFSRLGQNDKALQKYRESLLYATAGDVNLIIHIYLGKAGVFSKINKKDSALYYGREAFTLAQRTGIVNSILPASKFLTDFYIAQNNVDSAFYYQTATIAAKDSLFSNEKAREIQSLALEEVARQQQLEDAKVEAKTQVKFNALLGGIAFLIIIALILVRNNHVRNKANVLLKRQKQTVEITLNELKETQQQLIQSEKMASLGELTAGIAHEIQNPLNFVNNFSEVSNELLDEVLEEAAKGNFEEVKEILNDVKQNLEKINHHGKRADGIVKGMLQHSRSSSGVKEPTDINALCDEYLRLAYHGLRAKDKSFNTTLKTDYDNTIGNINIIPQDISRVILNLITNAFYAVAEKKSIQTTGYDPTVSVSTKKFKDKIEISVADNGNGIPQNIIDKIFQPFFTTKPTGQGTGLGLSLAYDIVKAHGGELRVETKDREYATFIIQVPVV